MLYHKTTSNSKSKSNSREQLSNRKKLSNLKQKQTGQKTNSNNNFIINSHLFNKINKDLIKTEKNFSNEKSKQKKIKKEKDAKKKQPEIKNNTLKSDENQILFNRVDEMRNKSNKKQTTHTIEEIDDDMILSSDFMTKK